jgi:hypothetical protein
MLGVPVQNGIHLVAIDRLFETAGTQDRLIWIGSDSPAAAMRCVVSDQASVDCNLSASRTNDLMASSL